MAPVLENRYNASMKNGISGKIIFLSALISLVVSSCAPVPTMFSRDEDGDEIKEIREKGVDVNKDNSMISEAANLILPYHREMDEIREDDAG